MKATSHRLARAPKHQIVIPDRAADRAVTRFILDQGTGCHISTYSTASHGYAQIGWRKGQDRNVTLAHRAAWVSAHGQIPVGATIDHMCKERRCVNLEHLRLLDNYENARRTAGRDWPLGQCINGHPDSHLRLYGNGAKTPRLRCQSCNREYQRRYDERCRRRKAHSL
jgi:hypothetical protein